MATKRKSGEKKRSVKGRPQPFYPKAGYNSNGKRFEDGGKVKKGSS